MKKRILFSLLALILLPWSQAFSQSNGKMILVEKITSVGCPGCPWGGYVLDSLEQDDPDIAVAAIHVHDQWHIDSLRCADGDTIVDVYKWGHPTAMVDRVKFSGQTEVAMTMSNWKSKIAERKLEALEVTVGANSTYDPNTRSLSVTIDGAVLWGLTGDVRVNLYVVESPVVGMGTGYDQLNGYDNVSSSPLYGLGNPIVGYAHKWVTRDMLGGPWGEAGVIPSMAPAGSGFSHTFNAILDPEWDDSKIYLIALVQRFHPDPAQRTILNAAKLGLNESVLADAEDARDFAGSVAVYPQPMGEEAWVRSPSAEVRELRIYDVQGREMRRESWVGGDIFRIERGDLESGMYVLQLWSRDGMVGSRKLLLR